jgi:hypothetical protein
MRNSVWGGQGTTLTSIKTPAHEITHSTVLKSTGNQQDKLPTGRGRQETLLVDKPNTITLNRQPLIKHGGRGETKTTKQRMELTLQLTKL